MENVTFLTQFWSIIYGIFAKKGFEKVEKVTVFGDKFYENVLYFSQKGNQKLSLFAEFFGQFLKNTLYFRQNWY